MLFDNYCFGILHNISDAELNLKWDGKLVKITKHPPTHNH